MALLRTRLLMKNQRSVSGLSSVNTARRIVSGVGAGSGLGQQVAHTHRAHLLRTKAGMALGGQLGVGRGRIMTYGNASGLQGPAE